MDNEVQMTYDEYIKSRIEEVRKNLIEYLGQEGIKVSNKSFSCPNKGAHKHGDAIPSASIFKGNEGYDLWYCHVCKSGVSTFHAAEIIEGLTIRGRGFIEKTLPYLCEKLSIEYDPEKYMSEKQKEIIQLYRANEKIAHAAESKLLSMWNNSPEHPAVKFCQSRGMTKEDITIFGIGFLPLNEALNVESDMGLPSAMRDEISVSPSLPVSRWIFHNDSIIFTLRDISG